MLIKLQEKSINLNISVLQFNYNIIIICNYGKVKSKEFVKIVKIMHFKSQYFNDFLRLQMLIKYLNFQDFKYI